MRGKKLILKRKFRFRCVVWRGCLGTVKRHKMAAQVTVPEVRKPHLAISMATEIVGHKTEDGSLSSLGCTSLAASLFFACPFPGGSGCRDEVARVEYLRWRQVTWLTWRVLLGTNLAGFKQGELDAVCLRWPAVQSWGTRSWVKEVLEVLMPHDLTGQKWALEDQNALLRHTVLRGLEWVSLVPQNCLYPATLKRLIGCGGTYLKSRGWSWVRGPPRLYSGTIRNKKRKR